MQKIHSTYKYASVPFEMPETVVKRTLCTETGLLANGDTCSKHTEYFAEGTVPKKTCPGEHAPAEAPAGEAPAEGGQTPAAPTTEGNTTTN